MEPKLLEVLFTDEMYKKAYGDRLKQTTLVTDKYILRALEPCEHSFEHCMSIQFVGDGNDRLAALRNYLDQHGNEKESRVLRFENVTLEIFEEENKLFDIRVSVRPDVTT